MVDYYTLAGFHCDAATDRRLGGSVSATARATRSVRDAVRIARDVTSGRRAPARVIPVALRSVTKDERRDEKPYSTI